MLEPHPAAHRLDLALDDREPQPRAAAIATAACIDPVEPLEDPLLLALGDALAAVRDRHPDPLLEGFDVDADLGVVTVLDRVVDQVLEHVIEAVARAEHREARRNLEV